MTTNALPELSKLALGATQASPATDTVLRAMELVRNQTGAVSALVFYGDQGEFEGAGVGDDPRAYPREALTYLQQRLVQLRVPLAFNLSDDIQFITRAANKQPRNFIAWLIPAADSWTELLILRGSWPPTAVQPLLDFVNSAMPAITIVLERLVGVGRKQRLERQLAAIGSSVDTLGRSAEIIGSVAAVSPTMQGLAEDQVIVLQDLAGRAQNALDELRANRDVMEAHLKLQEYTSRLERTVQAERQQAKTDALTGLMNHRGGLQALEAAFDVAAAEDTPLSLLLGDVDGFKLFNDSYGHVMGDDVLRVVGNVCRDTTGAAGTVCRYGGDEFLIILPSTSSDAATALANEIMERLARAEFRTDSDIVVPLRMSIGVATYPTDTTEPAKLIAIADAAMYEAKKHPMGAKGPAVKTSADTSFGVLESLMLAIDSRDSYTKDHCDIVAEYASKLAARLELPEKSSRALRTAGLLHDIGKLAVPDEVLKKPAPLNQEEYEVMQRHVRIGETLIREVPQLRDVIQAVSCHHERFDGSGYPRGLKGASIPLLGRVISLVDAYSAMSLDRPYRRAMPHDRVLNELVAGAGLQFDPDLTKVFIELLLEEQIQKRTAA